MKGGCSEAGFPQVQPRLCEDTASSTNSLKVARPRETAATGANRNNKRRRKDKEALKNGDMQLVAIEPSVLGDTRSSTSSNQVPQRSQPQNKTHGVIQCTSRFDSDFRRTETEQEILNSALQLGPKFSMQSFIFDGEEPCKNMVLCES